MLIDTKDIRYAIRTLLRNRGFTATALVTLALGIGATTAMFSIVDAVLLRPLAYRDPARLVVFFEDLSQIGYPRARVSPPTYLDLKAQRQLFEDVAAINETAFNVSGDSGGARQLNGVLATYNLFSLLGVKPLLGRTFLPEEDRPGANHVALLSFHLWRNRFGGNPAIVGQAIRLNGEPYTVVGIMPAGFSFPERGLTEAGAEQINPIDVWTPRAFTPQELTPRQGRYLTVAGRLRADASLPKVNAALRVLALQNARLYPNDMRGVSRFFAEALQESDTHDVERGLLMLMIAVGFILLIACANVANLLLSRAAARSREMAMRMALGAGRGRIVRQLLTESALLSLAGGVIGISFAAASFAFLKHLVPEDLARSVAPTFNLPVLGFAILASLSSSFLFGLAPALQISKADLNEALREGGRGATGSRQTLGNLFVAGEVALSLMLLVSAGLLLKSLAKLRQVDTGFQSAHVLTLDFDMAEPRYRDWNVRTRFLERVLERTRALPGVESAGFAGGLPLTSRGWTEEVTAERATASRGGPANMIYRVITPGFLETLRVPLIRGRFFDNRDREDAPLVAVINRRAAQDFWPHQNPLGKRLKLGRVESANPWMQVVGVTAEVKHSGLTDVPRQEIYCPYLQARATLQWQRFLVVRTSGDPLLIVGKLGQIASDLDADEPLNHVALLSDIVEGETAQSKTQSIMLGVLAALALVMACVGIYGLMAYMVAQRVQEMGVRMALGAQRADVLALVLRKGMLLALLGAGVGVAGAVGLSRLMRGLLFEVSPTDPLIISLVSILLMAVAVLACLIPARRAASIDPMQALRTE